MDTKKRRKGNRTIEKFGKLRKHLSERRVPVSPNAFQGDYIFMEGKISSNLPPRAVCTCGKFQTERSESFAELARQAVEHREETGHQLRQHAS